MTSPSEYAKAVMSYLRDEGWDLSGTHVSDDTYLLGGTLDADGDTQHGVVIIAAGEEESFAQPHLDYLERALDRYDADVGIAHARGGVPDTIASECSTNGYRIIESTTIQSYHSTESPEAASGSGAERTDSRAQPGTPADRLQSVDLSRRAMVTAVAASGGAIATAGWYLLNAVTGSEQTTAAPDAATDPDADGGTEPAADTRSPTESESQTTGRESVIEGADGATMFQYDIANTGVARGETGPETGVSQQWSVGVSGPVHCSPAVVDDTVYIGSDGGTLHALDVTDGTEQWTVDTDEWIRSSPTVTSDTVYFGDNSGLMYAIDRADGSERWRFSSRNRIRSSATIVDGTLYFGNIGDVFALDVADGTQEWQYRADAEVSSSPAVVDGTVYIGMDDGSVSAFDAADGTLSWQYQAGAGVRSSPAVADGTVFVGDLDGTVHALSGADGTEQWTFDATGRIWGSPCVLENTVFIGSEQRLYALATDDGTRRWSIYAYKGFEAPPTVANGIVYVGSPGGTFYAFDAADGTERWTFEAGRIEGGAAVVDGAVFFGSSETDNTVYALA